VGSRPPALPRPVGFVARGVRVTVVVNVFTGGPCNEGEMFRLRWLPVHHVVIDIIVDAFGLLHAFCNLMLPRGPAGPKRAGRRLLVP
jgi:hypothetical protein